MKTPLLLLATLINFTTIETTSANVADKVEDRFDHRADRIEQ